MVYRQWMLKWRTEFKHRRGINRTLGMVVWWFMPAILTLGRLRQETFGILKPACDSKDQAASTVCISGLALNSLSSPVGFKFTAVSSLSLLDSGVTDTHTPVCSWDFGDVYIFSDHWQFSRLCKDWTWELSTQILSFIWLWREEHSRPWVASSYKSLSVYCSLKVEVVRRRSLLKGPCEIWGSLVQRFGQARSLGHNLKFYRWPEPAAPMVWALDLELKVEILQWLGFNLAWMVLDGINVIAFGSLYKRENWPIAMWPQHTFLPVIYITINLPSWSPNPGLNVFVFSCVYLILDPTCWTNLPF